MPSPLPLPPPAVAASAACSCGLGHPLAQCCTLHSTPPPSTSRSRGSPATTAETPSRRWEGSPGAAALPAALVKATPPAVCLWAVTLRAHPGLAEPSPCTGLPNSLQRMLTPAPRSLPLPSLPPPPPPLLQPKLAQHCNQCSASGFTCIDCSLSFDRRSVQASLPGLPARIACLLPACLPASLSLRLDCLLDC